MAKKKTTQTTKNRQRAKKPLPVTNAAKKPMVAKKSKKTVAPKTKSNKVAAGKKKTQKPAPQRRSAKKIIIREYRIPFGPSTHLLIQLKRNKKPIGKKKPATGLSTKLSALSKRLRRIPAGLPFIIIGIAGTLYFATDIFRPRPNLTVYSPPAPVLAQMPMPEIKPKTFPKSDPVSLNVPDIGLSTSLITVGRQTDGTLEVPGSPDVPGWYRLSPTPGELGPAIIVGHVDSPAGPGIFWRLRELTPAKIIEVKRTDNTTVKFKVTEILQFEQDNFPTDKVYGNIDHAGLRLITCGGTYNRLTDSYSHNTVVFASLIE